MNIDARDIPFTTIEKFLHDKSVIFLVGNDGETLIETSDCPAVGTGIRHLKANLPLRLLEDVVNSDFILQIRGEGTVHYSLGCGEDSELSREMASELISFSDAYRHIYDRWVLISAELLALGLPSYLWFKRDASSRKDPLLSLLGKIGDLCLDLETVVQIIITNILKGIEKFKAPTTQFNLAKFYEKHPVVSHLIFNHQPDLFPIIEIDGAEKIRRGRGRGRDKINTIAIVDTKCYQEICRNFPIVEAALRSLDQKPVEENGKIWSSDKQLTISASDGVDVTFPLEYLSSVSGTVRDLIKECDSSDISFSAPYPSEILTVLKEPSCNLDPNLLSTFEELLRYFDIDDRRYDPLSIKFLNQKFPDFNLESILKYNYPDEEIRHRRVKMLLDNPNLIIHDFCYFLVMMAVDIRKKFFSRVTGSLVENMILLISLDDGSRIHIETEKFAPFILYPEEEIISRNRYLVKDNLLLEHIIRNMPRSLE